LQRTGLILLNCVGCYLYRDYDLNACYIVSKLCGLLSIFWIAGAMCGCLLTSVPSGPLFKEKKIEHLISMDELVVYHGSKDDRR
jgi:hypothetical protein